MHRFTLFSVIALLFVFAGCNASAEGASIESAETPAPVLGEKITFSNALNMIEANKDNSDFIILDVRTPEEFGSGCLKNAVNIDYKSPDFKDRLEKLDKSKPYIVYCRSGRRSAEAMNIMAQAGFSNVYDLSGGITAWANDGGIVTDACPA